MFWYMLDLFWNILKTDEYIKIENKKIIANDQIIETWRGNPFWVHILKDSKFKDNISDFLDCRQKIILGKSSVLDLCPWYLSLSAGVRECENLLRNCNNAAQNKFHFTRQNGENFTTSQMKTKIPWKFWS